MNKPSDQYIFPIIVAVISALSLIRGFQNFQISTAVVSVIGLLAVFLFFKNKSYSQCFFLAWIVAQVITLVTLNFALVGNQLPEISLSFSLSGSTYLFSLNFAPLLYFIGFNSLNFNSIVGKVVQMTPEKEETHLLNAKGMVKEYVEFTGQGKWYRIDVNEDQSLYFKGRDVHLFKSGVPVTVDVRSYDTDNQKLKFEGWGEVVLQG